MWWRPLQGLISLVECLAACLQLLLVGVEEEGGRVNLAWAVLWLVNKIFHTLWVKVQLLKTNDTSRFWAIFENSQNCKQIIGVSRRSIFHAPKSSQMPYSATNQKIYDFTNRIKNPLELRLVLGEAWTLGQAPGSRE